MSIKQENRQVIAIILVIVAIIAIAGFSIRSSYAENTGGTPRNRADEATLVRMTATTTKLKSSADEIDTDGLRTEIEGHVGKKVVTVEDESSEIILVTFLKTGNQYVWVEVPKTTTVYPTTGLTETPVIKQNAYPYNWVTCSQAQTLASGFAAQLDGYTSSLMFGVQWDLVLRYLETKGATQSELNSDSKSWGNYYNNSWNIDNASSKYAVNGSNWTDGAYGKGETYKINKLEHR